MRFFEQIGRNDSDKIEKAKGTKGKNTKEQIIYEILNGLFKEYTNQLEAKQIA